VDKGHILERLAEDALRFYRTKRKPVPRFGIWMNGTVQWVEPDKALFDSGESKDFTFREIRKFVDTHPVKAICFCSDTWKFTLTPEGNEAMTLDPKLRSTAPDEWLDRGLAIRSEVLIINVQDADNVILIQVPYERIDSGVSWGEPERVLLTQEEFDGRQKMFGRLPSPESFHSKGGI